MKKQWFAVLMTAILSVGTMPAAGAAVDSKDTRTYREAMDNMPYASSYLVDFDGDGTDELLLWDYRQNGDQQYEVWDGSKKLVSGSLEFQLGDETAYYELARSKNAPGKMFLRYVFRLRNDHQLYATYTVENGVWSKVEDAKWVESYQDDGFTTDNHVNDHYFTGQGMADYEMFQQLVAEMDAKYTRVEMLQANHSDRDVVIAAIGAPSSWAQAEIEAAGGTQLIDSLFGYPDWQDTVTRRQFCWLIVQMTESHLQQLMASAPSTIFSDCNDGYICKAYAAGIVNGTSDTTFSPENQLTREQLATMLWRAAAYIQEQTGEQVLTTGGSLTDYTDANQVSAYAKEAVASLAQHGIMKGTSATQLSPQENCSVEQSVLLTYRMMHKLS